MVQKFVQINHPNGLSSKTAAIFVESANKFDSQIIIEKANKKVNAKSIMGVMSLAVGKGESLHITANGTDEEEALLALEAILQSGSDKK